MVSPYKRNATWNQKKMIRKMLDPYKVFISLLIAIAFWLAPIGVSEPIPVEESYTAIDEFSLYPKLIQAIVPELSRTLIQPPRLTTFSKGV